MLTGPPNPPPAPPRLTRGEWLLLLLIAVGTVLACVYLSPGAQAR